MITDDGVYRIVRLIPKGKVLTYGRVAKLTGIKSPRYVGRVLHLNKDPITAFEKTLGFQPGDESNADMSLSFKSETPRNLRGENVINIPCHRVVNSKGMVARSYAFGGEEVQKKMLTSEGVLFTNNRVDLKKYLWEPKGGEINEKR
ncbi:hypothetical protein A3A50_05190 [Candidatus Woesebacteria bacterium RIFCSPLOWO2_01_FULL_38_20]|nr:MAG: hypothetical protein A3A50_05190 [Candidatus Woesebacteria bacterium RIFCSPLOWO2_01_FULL_38_20]